jgi:hypothetical protein
MLAGGAKMALDYSAILTSVASYGYVVVGTESCVSDYCVLFYQDVLHTIEACRVNGTTMNPIFAQTDFTRVGG